MLQQLDTADTVRRGLVLHVFSALADFERNLIRERTATGLAAARARGRKGGRKPTRDAKRVREIKLLLNDPRSPGFGCSTPSSGLTHYSLQSKEMK